MNHRKKIIDATLKMRGDNYEIMKAIEEMGELSKELIKNINSNKDNRDEIIEEFAHVMLSMEFLKRIYTLTDAEISSEFDLKISVLEKKLEQKNA